MAEQDDLVTQLSQISGHPWGKERWNRFMSCTPDEQKLMVQMLQDSTAAAPASAWTVALAILQTAEQVAATVSGIGGAIGAIQAIVKLA